MPQRARRSSVLGRAFLILDCFGRDRPHLTLTELATDAELPLTTAHRITREMLDLEVLTRNTTGSFSVGPRLWELGLLTSVHREIGEAARPYMSDVLVTTRQIVNLMVLEQGSALVVERVAGTAKGPAIAEIGDRLPLNSSAGGKVFLAYGATEWRRGSLARETAHSIAEPERLQTELETVRRQGFASTDQEHRVGAWGLAVPVPGKNGRPLAALGIVSLNPINDPGHLVPVLEISARAISRAVGQSGHGHLSRGQRDAAGGSA